MVEALAPGLSRGFSRVWLSLALLALSPLSALGQTDGTKGAAKKGDVPKAEATKEAPAKADAADDDDDDDSTLKKQETVEIFKDPRASKALQVFNQLQYPNPRLREPADLALLRTMAANPGTVDRTLMERVVTSMAADMTNRANIKAVIDPPANLPPTSPSFRAIERASQYLVELLNLAREKKNDAFLAVYTQILFEKLTPLLQNNYIPRFQASIILGLAARPDMIDVFTKQIADPNQMVWVKHWSANGLTNATNGGRVILDIQKSTAAAAALVGFLDKEPDSPWPVKMRVFEAFGSMRLASITGPGGKPVVPAVALKYVGDSSMRLEVRAWAAWSLGMVPIPSSMARFNYGLEAYQIGRLAAEMGDKIGGEFDLHEKDFAKRSDYAKMLTGLLLYQVYPSIAGDDQIQDSGLLRVRALGTAQPFVRGLEDQLKGLARASNELIRSGGNEMKDRRTEVRSRVAELKTYLEKNVPKDSELFPGGPKYPVAPPQVAGVRPAK